MWSRKELKAQSKLAVKRNYWKSVLVTLVYAMIIGGIGVFGGMGSSFNGANSGGETESFIGFLPAGVWAAIGVIVFIAVILAILFAILFVNPFAIGTYKFSLNALRGTGNVSDIGYGFDVSYKRNVKVLLLMDIYTILWTCLFIIPGLVKSYEYRMIPYLLAENPEMGKEEAFKTSKTMMKGNKWRAFVLDLSFILWDILGALTFGLVKVFWVDPYKFLTDAALFDALKED